MYHETRKNDVIAVLRIASKDRQVIGRVLDRLELIYELGDPSRFIPNREDDGCHVFVDILREASR